MDFRADASTIATAALPTLIAGDFPRITRKRTIASGAGVLAAGTVLGRITASGKLVKSASASSDGSQAVHAILAEDVDASAADIEAVVWFTGDFNPDAMTFGTGHTATSTRDAFRDMSIFI